MKLRAGLFAATVIAALAPIGSLTAASADPIAMGDPGIATAPSFSFLAGCRHMDGTRASLAACDSVAIPDFNQARAAEGLTPLVLPNDFDLLSVPEQLLALTNIERVDRNLAPVPALSSSLNKLAQAGATAGQAPALPSPTPGTGGGGNSFQGGSALLADYEWMYDDAAAGWSDRHNILGSGGVSVGAFGYDNPIAMGAARVGGTVTALLIGGDSTDKADVTPTWAQIVATSTFGLDKINASVQVSPGTSASVPVTATSSSVTGTMSAVITHGGDEWSVTPSSCQITPGASCTFVVTFAPPTAGRFPGLLSVSNGLTLDTVALAGVGLSPRLTMDLSRFNLRRGSLLTVYGQVRDAGDNDVLGGVVVSLQSRSTPYSPWRTIGTQSSTGAGTLIYQLRPTSTAAYRLAVLDASGAVETVSGTERARVF